MSMEDAKEKLENGKMIKMSIARMHY